MSIGPELAEGKVCDLLVGANPEDLAEKLKSFYKSIKYTGIPLVTKCGADEDFSLIIHYTPNPRYCPEGITGEQGEVTFPLLGKLKTIIEELTFAAEDQIIRKTLKETRGVKSRACDLLGITRPTLDSKIRQYEIDVNEFKQ